MCQAMKEDVNDIFSSSPFDAITRHRQIFVPDRSYLWGFLSRNTDEKKILV